MLNAKFSALQMIRLLGLLLMVHSISFAQEGTNFNGQFNAQQFKGIVSSKEISKELRYAQFIFEDSLTESLKLVEKNLELAIQFGYENEEALALKILGDMNISLNNNSSAINHLKKSNQIYTRLKDVKNIIATHDLLGDSYSKLKKPELAIQQWLKADKFGNQSDEKVVELNLKIGNEYLKTVSYSKAKIHFEKVLKLSKQLDDKAGIVSATIGLGKVEEKKGENQMAEQLFESANVGAESINSIELTNSSLNSLSNLYENSNNSVDNIRIKEKAIDFNNYVGNYEEVLQNSTEIAKFLIEEGDEYKAIEILNQSSDIVKNQNNNETKRDFYKTLAEAYKAKGEIEKSQAITQEYNVLMDSFKLLEAQKHELIEVKNSIIQNTENKISLLEKDRVINEKTIQLLQQEQVLKDESIKNQKVVMTFLGIGILLVATIIFFIFRSNKEKKRNNQLLTLKSLRNQMNPHFIFNSLNSVNVYISQQDERAANQYLAEFSKLMRLVLNYSQNDFIPLSKEIEILSSYLNLEHDRFKENFDFEIDCPNSINLEAYQISPMLLQPIVENAIWHGLRYKPEKGFLKVQFIEEDEGLKITVTDNGIGREQSFKHKTASQLKMKSTGINNVKDRIEIIKAAYKKELSVEIADLNPETKEGTAVTVLLRA